MPLTALRTRDKKPIHPNERLRCGFVGRTSLMFSAFHTQFDSVYNCKCGHPECSWRF